MLNFNWEFWLLAVQGERCGTSEDSGLFECYLLLPKSGLYWFQQGSAKLIWHRLSVTPAASMDWRPSLRPLNYVTDSQQPGVPEKQFLSQRPYVPYLPDYWRDCPLCLWQGEYQTVFNLIDRRYNKEKEVLIWSSLVTRTRLFGVRISRKMLLYCVH